MAEESVKVAVRVRPFNKREIARNATLIVDMKGPTTYIQDPENPKEEPRSFTFDYSYWSHDGCKEDPKGYISPDTSHPNGKKFADQISVYDDLGAGVLKNAWEGYNSTLFAYGQTGSGKSWSIVGYGVNKGIVPQFCDNIFKGIDAKKKEGDAAEYEVVLTMLEIYNENVHDLLNPSKSKAGLKVRQHPKKGFYAEGLKNVSVGSYAEIAGKMDEGTMNRTVAATNMNATSSRAHTLVGITFSQKFKNAAGEERTKTALVNLVDLAGSERADSTGATGDRLKEGAAINQSLSALGNVISALADRSSGKNVRVPFRDSMLTKLLKNALGGNSKTIMIAAVSPADINYDESLSTLRYADRAKQIKTSVSVNEDPTEKLIRELQMENEKLKKMLEGGAIVVPTGDGESGIEIEDGMSEAEKKAMKQELEEEFQAQLKANAQEMEEMKKAFEDKLKESREETKSGGNNISETNEKKKKVAHLYNLNVDPQLSGKIIHFLDSATKKIGNQKGDAEVILMGPSIQPAHATIFCEKDKFHIEQEGSARLLLNGEPVTKKTELHHNDRLVFGTTQLYVFCNPKERDSSKQKYPDITFESAQEEIAAMSGFDMQTENKSRDDMLTQEDLMEMLPAVEEANSISEDLDKKKKFEIMLVSPEARGEAKGRTLIYVRVIDLETGLEWTWPREKFLNRKFLMQEMFANFQDGEDVNWPEDKDPFAEDPNAEIHIGSVKVWLQSLAYSIEIKEQLEITDFRGQEVGLLNLEIIPCSKKGKEYTEKDDVWVDNPEDMIGKDIHFILKVNSARGLPKRFTDVYCKYHVYLDDEPSTCKPIKDTINPDWKHKKQFDFSPATQAFIKYLQEGGLIVQIWGKQKPVKTKKSVNTKEAVKQQELTKGHVQAANSNIKLVDAEKVKFAMQLAVSKKKAEKAEMKVNQFKQLVKLAEEYQKPRISTKLIKDLLHAPTQDVAEKCLKMVPKETGADGSDGGSPQTDKSSTCVLL